MKLYNGPILFSIYINDLIEIDINGNIISLEDDTVLFVEDESWNEIETKAIIEISNIQDQYSKKTTLNYQKSVFFFFFMY